MNKALESIGNDLTKALLDVRPQQIQVLSESFDRSLSSIKSSIEGIRDSGEKKELKERNAERLVIGSWIGSTLVLKDFSLTVNQERRTLLIEKIADSNLSGFRQKCLSKLAGIMLQRDGAEARLGKLYVSSGLPSGEIEVSYEGGDSFSLRTQTVWVSGSYNRRPFSQYPSRFHDVKFLGEVESFRPEAWMLFVFTGQMDAEEFGKISELELQKRMDRVPTYATGETKLPEDEAILAIERMKREKPEILKSVLSALKLRLKQGMVLSSELSAILKEEVENVISIPRSPRTVTVEGVQAFEGARAMFEDALSKDASFVSLDEVLDSHEKEIMESSGIAESLVRSSEAASILIRYGENLWRDQAVRKGLIIPVMKKVMLGDFNDLSRALGITAGRYKDVYARQAVTPSREAVLKLNGGWVALRDSITREEIEAKVFANIERGVRDYLESDKTKKLLAKKAVSEEFVRERLFGWQRLEEGLLLFPKILEVIFGSESLTELKERISAFEGGDYVRWLRLDDLFSFYGERKEDFAEMISISISSEIRSCLYFQSEKINEWVFGETIDD